jgi:transposase InsO family protein
VIDCYSKKVLGWSIAENLRTELVADALRNAAATTRIEPDAIRQSDRGSDSFVTACPGLIVSSMETGVTRINRPTLHPRRSGGPQMRQRRRPRGGFL